MADDYIGDDYVGDDDVVGAALKRVARRGGKVWRRPPLPARPAQPTTAELRSFVGMGTIKITDTDAGDKTLTQVLQETFRPERLMITVIDDSSASQGLVKSIQVGVMPQSPALGSTPVEMFGPQAVGAGLECQVVEKGTSLSVTIGVDQAPASGKSIRFTVGFYGQWIR